MDGTASSVLIRVHPVRQAKLGCSSKMKGVCHVNWTLNMKPTERQPGVTPEVEASEGELASRSDQRTRFSLVTPMGTAKRSDTMKPTPDGKQCSSAPFGFPGVRGDSAQAKEQPGTWDKPGAVSGQADKHDEGINNLVGCRNREAERLVVATKRGNARGAKEPWRKTSGVRRARS